MIPKKILLVFFGKDQQKCLNPLKIAKQQAQSLAERIHKSRAAFFSHYKGSIPDSRFLQPIALTDAGLFFRDNPYDLNRDEPLAQPDKKESRCIIL